MKNKDYKVRIDGIEIIEKALYIFSAEENDNYKFKVITESVVDRTKKIIVVFVLINVVKEKDVNESIAKLVVAMGFGIEDFEKALKTNKLNVFKIPSELENFLKGIAISTIRGIMYSEFRGTAIHKAILPIILIDSLTAASPDDEVLMARIKAKK